MIKKLLVAVTAMVMIATGVLAYTEKVNGITWTYTVSDGKASISDVPETTTGAITIPSSLGGYPVTSIGEYAFEDCSGLTSVTIPNSVTSIGKYAFSSCSGLTSITIPDSVTSIGDLAFSCCPKLVEVIIKSSLSISKDSSSYGHVALYALDVHSGESKIVNYNDYLFYTFKGVNYLLGYVGTNTALILPNNYKGENYEIYAYAFFGCDGLTSVTIPNSVTSIGYRAFSGCSGLTSITIGNSVTSIGEKAFEGCSLGIVFKVLEVQALLGDADAQNNLGEMYENGLGVTQDYSEAVKWYCKSAEQGNDFAKRKLNELSNK